MVNVKITPPFSCPIAPNYLKTEELKTVFLQHKMALLNESKIFT